MIWNRFPRFGHNFILYVLFAFAALTIFTAVTGYFSFCFMYTIPTYHLSLIHISKALNIFHALQLLQQTHSLNIMFLQFLLYPFDYMNLYQKIPTSWHVILQWHITPTQLLNLATNRCASYLLIFRSALIFFLQ